MRYTSSFPVLDFHFVVCLIMLVHWLVKTWYEILKSSTHSVITRLWVAGNAITSVVMTVFTDHHQWFNITLKSLTYLFIVEMLPPGAYHSSSMGHMRAQMAPGSTPPYGYSQQMSNQSAYNHPQSSPNYPMASNHQNGSSLEQLEKVSKCSLPHRL